MKAAWYAEALYRALEGKKENEVGKVVERLYEVMRARGHQGLIKLIPREFQKIGERVQKERETILVTADAKSHTKWAHAYDHYEKEGLFPQNAARRDVVDETIIGGYQIRTKDLLIDSSYKRSLIELYQNITNTH